MEHVEACIAAVDAEDGPVGGEDREHGAIPQATVQPVAPDADERFRAYDDALRGEDGVESAGEGEVDETVDHRCSGGTMTVLFMAVLQQMALRTHRAELDDATSVR